MPEDKLGAEVQGYWNSYKKNVIDIRHPLWLEFVQKYQSDVASMKTAGVRESNLFVPRSFDSVETAVPRILLALFSVKPPFQAIGRGKSDMQNAETITDVYTYFNDRLNYFGFCSNLLRVSAIYGTGIVKMGWDKSRNMPVRYLVHPQDFFIDPTASCIEEATYCGDRKIRPLSYLLDMEKRGIYKNIATVKKDGARYSPGGNELLTGQKGVYGQQNPYSEWKDEKNPQYEVIECYLEGGKKVRTTAGGITIRDEKNPFYSEKMVSSTDAYPYAPTYLVPSTNDFYGIGLIEPVRFIQDEINDLHNARMDYIGRALNMTSLVAVSEWENSKTWKHKMGALWKCNSLDGVKQVDMKPLAPEAFAMGAELNQQFDRTLALSDYVRGTAGGNESATGATILAQAADTRLKLQLYTVQNCLKRMVAFDLRNIQEFLPSETVIRITEKPYVKTVKRDEIVGEFDIFAAGVADLTTKDMKRSQLVNLLNVMIGAGVPQLMVMEGKRISVSGIMKEIIDTFEIKSADSIISDMPMPEMGGMGGGAVLPMGGAPTDMQGLMKSTAEETAPMQSLAVGGV